MGIESPRLAAAAWTPFAAAKLSAHSLLKTKNVLDLLLAAASHAAFGNSTVSPARSRMILPNITASSVGMTMSRTSGKNGTSIAKPMQRSEKPSTENVSWVRALSMPFARVEQVAQ
jgi:hypothetical protein